MENPLWRPLMGKAERRRRQMEGKIVKVTLSSCFKPAPFYNNVNRFSGQIRFKDRAKIMYILQNGILDSFFPQSGIYVRPAY